MPATRDILNHAIQHTTASYDYEPRTLEQRIAFFEEHEREGYPIFVAEEDSGAVVGWSSLSRFHQKPGYRFSVENSVYVAAEHRSKGIGRLLMQALVESAHDRGFHAIIALIDAANEPSIRLHARFGFEKVGCLRQVGFKFNRWLDVVYMERLIETSTEKATIQ